MSLTKKTNQKFFFTAASKACQVFWGFEQLSSTIGSGVMPAHKDKWKLLDLGQNHSGFKGVQLKKSTND